MKKLFKLNREFKFSNKRIVYNTVLLLLTCNIILFENVSAQENFSIQSAIIVPNGELNIGDMIPESLWNMPLEVVNHPEGKKTITLNEYRGKLIILDFWAYYCGSCIATMPRIHKLQKQFKNDIVILNVTADSSKVASNCLSTNPRIKNLKLFSIANDKILSTIFPHQFIPHYVWIAKDSRYISQSASSFINEENITKILQGKASDWQEKSDIDTKRPLFLGNQLPPDVELKNYSILIAGRVSGLGGGHGASYPYNQQQRDKYYLNSPLKQIYTLIASKLV